MERKIESGQLVIELALLSLFFVSLLLLSTSFANGAKNRQSQFQFKSRSLAPFQDNSRGTR
jgi:hypothetical protein